MIDDKLVALDATGAKNYALKQSLAKAAQEILLNNVSTYQMFKVASM